MRFSDLEGAAVGVWGAGREVSAFARQLARRLPAARIVAAAFDGAPEQDVLARLGAPGARVGSGPDAASVLEGCEVVVRSPGVSIHRPELERLRKLGAPVTTPTALWLAERGGRGVIGITGTKGKSTTAALTCHLARAAGRPARLAGNIGVPAIELLDGEPGDPDVVELSSYHTADAEIGPEVAVLTNLFREHADWHGSEEAYRREKLRLLGLPGVRVRVVPGRDPPPAAVPGQGRLLRFGDRRGWEVDGEALRRSGVAVMDVAELVLPGPHNALNLCAALTALEAYGIKIPSLPEGLSGFSPLPHRLETVAEDGRTWVDDSISTTPESALAALASFPGRELVLIAGGQDRGQDLDVLARELARRGAAVIGIPSTGPALVAAARAAGVPPDRAREAPDLAAAVRLALDLAPSGSVVLLSPAAPSYDNFRNFEERGERFTGLVRDAPAAGTADLPGPG